MEDNNGAIAWANELGHHNKRKHIDLATWNVYEQTKNKIIVLDYIQSKENKADCLTKSLKTKDEFIAKFNALSGKTSTIELQPHKQDDLAQPLQKQPRR